MVLLFVIDLKSIFLSLSGANELLQKTIFSLSSKKMTWDAIGEIDRRNPVFRNDEQQRAADQPAHQNSLISAFVISY